MIRIIKKHLPNFLSDLRIKSIGPIWYFFATNPGLSFIILCGAIATDALDGYLARRFKTQSEFGKALDPIADKFLYLSLMPLILWGHVPLTFWVFWLTLPSETALAARRLPLFKNMFSNPETAATAAGKIKMAIQWSGLLLMTAGIVLQSEPLKTTGLIASFIAIPFSWWSLYSHLMPKTALIQK